MAALHAVARCRPIAAALLLAASADAKPWALAFVPLLLVLPRDRWHRAVAAWLATVIAAWLPFVLADPHTLHAGGFTIPNVASSSLRVLGVTAASTPFWDRPVQLLAGCVLGLVAVRRGRWMVVPAVVLAVRLLLDPGAYPYYTSGLVLATILVDLGWRKTRWPWVSIAVVVGMYAVRFMSPLTPTNAQLGWLRAITLLAVLGVALGPDLRECSFTSARERLRAVWDSHHGPSLPVPHHRSDRMASTAHMRLLLTSDSAPHRPSTLRPDGAFVVTSSGNVIRWRAFSPR